ncbi:MAG: HlyD family efflux transporter periplasmic adaptor subunit [Flavobacteriales bacterium]|nr:HlyD family efflux transporter periplasmic adaptor subunit [Flavobacteriales bacterium]MCB9190493.1 HlyD family efflux transporter periplasmic adaptor subunit [Flavobacteriales bacterium]
MTRKIIIVLVAVAIVAGGVFAMRKLADSKKPPEKKKTKQITTVFTQKVENRAVPITLSATGSLTAKNRIDLFAEVQGVMLSSAKPFKAGTRYNKGERLVEIESDVFSAGLQAQKSELQNLLTAALPDLKLDFPDAFGKWENFLSSIDINKPLPTLPEIASDKERLFITGRKVFSTYYNVKNAELTLQKYDLFAPFNGVLIEALVDPGTLIRPGQKLGTFIDPTVYEMETPIPSSMVKHISIGQSVELHTTSELENTWTGKITRINSAVNAGTQTVNAYIEVSGAHLEEGMFLEATIKATEIEDAFAIDRSVLFEEDQVYIAKDTLLVQYQVEPLYLNEKTVVVRGLKDGDEVLTKMPPSAYPGMKISIYEEKN